MSGNLTGAAFDLFEEAQKRGYLDRLLMALKKKHRILVLGSTGVGKTNFLKSLKESLPEAISALTRTPVATKYNLVLEKEPFVFVDTPGQRASGPRRVEAIREAMKGGLAGIINVVSDGYHEYATDREAALEGGGAISEEFLARHRQVEIQALHEWASLLGHQKTADWLLTVVSKADLWWHRKEEVLAHYETGPYFQALQAAQSLNPMVLPYCSVIHKFYGEGSVSGRFDDNDRVKLRTHLIAEMAAAIGKAR